MAGAMAGTAILNCNLSKTLHTVTLTINNSCNLECPHCYLQYERGAPNEIRRETLMSVNDSQFNHLAIVGKEPLANKASISRTTQIAKFSGRNLKTVSLITNGLNLSMASSELLKNLSYIDLSLDGGPNTYEKYRKGSLRKLLCGLRKLESKGFRQVNALHVLNSRTIHQVNDMMEAGDFFDFGYIMFSPFVNTSNYGTNSVDALETERIFDTLSKSKLFMDEPRAFLLISKDSILFSEKNCSIKSLASKYGVNKKVKYIGEDPLLYGIIRITYDGYALTPYQSLDTINYRRVGIQLKQLSKGNRDLQKIYKAMCNDYTPSNN